MTPSLQSLYQIRDEVIELYEKLGQFKATAEVLKERYPTLPAVSHLREVVAEFIKLNVADVDIVQQSVKLSKQNQRLQDTQRIERKGAREYIRAENALVELNTKVVELLESCQDRLGKPFHSTNYNPHEHVLVVHLSDLHFNELIDLKDNQYDFEVAGKRLYLLAQKVKKIAATYDVSLITVAIGGDLVNSDRRLDEVLTMATNRAKAVVLGTHLLRQFLQDLAESCQINVFGITGNEGRAKKELCWSEPGVTDSYDASIYWMLQTQLVNDHRIVFYPLRGNDAIFQIFNQTFLLVHGHQINMNDQKAVQSLIGKYANQGINVTHVLAGHIHSTMISDFASRNSSLCGSNAYSSHALNFMSKAAQNVHIVTKQGLDAMKCDLQNVDSIPGYDILNLQSELGANATPGSESQTSSVTVLVS